MFQISDSELMFSQCAQYPEDFDVMYHSKAESSKQVPKSKKLSQRREKRKRQNSAKSFVMSRLHQRGIKLIKISVIDLCNNNIQPSDSDSDSENIIINAQYIVKDAMDSVMDETESLVKKISKSLIDSDF